MDTSSRTQWRITEIPISMLVFIILLGYTYGIFTYIPYIGFYFDPNTGKVLETYTSNEGSLQTGDVLKKVGDIQFDDYKNDGSQPLFFSTQQKDDSVSIEIERRGEIIVLDWVIPGLNPIEFRGRLFNIHWMAYIFWAFGVFMEMSIRPREIRQKLLLSSNHLTSLWLMFGSISTWHLLGSTLLFHALTWFLAGIYLHQNWIYPKPLAALPKWITPIFYSFISLMAFGELFQILPRYLFYFPLLLAFVGSFILLILHFILQPEHRRVLGLLALFTFLAVLPSIVMAIMGLLHNALPVYSPLALIALTFIPVAYLYLIVRDRLGGLELKANRLVTVFSFLILLGTLLAVILNLTAPLHIEENSWMGVVLPLVTALISLNMFPRFERFIDRSLLGIKLPYQHLPETYSSRIAVSASLPSLLALLKDEVFPSLLIRQYAFLQTDDNNLTPLLAKDVPDTTFDVDTLTQKAGSYIPTIQPHADWLRLILPLRVGDKTLGFWLLGKRDPDDLYPQVEIPILQSLADQTAIALSNILNAEQLRGFYQADIENIEYERKRISRDLHDTVLNELAAMRNSLEQKTLPASFLSSYDHVKKRLREIINDIRPPILDQGLASALDELMEDLREKNEAVNIHLQLQSDAERLPQKMEEHIYQIVREACENALNHANARTLTISGEISPVRVNLSIQDDGKGFETNSNPNTLIANRHFGLVNMKERAHILGAEMEIRSQERAGTKIHITWKK